MLFKTSELRDFFNKTKAIRVNNVLPILSYVKYENGTLTKTNMETYFTSEISTKNKGSFLLDEKTISAKLKETTDETINIEVNGKFCTIGKLKFPIEDVEQFPKAPLFEDEKKVSLDEAIIRSIGVFRQLTMTQDPPNNLCYVHLNSSGVYATNNHSFANVEFYAELPEILLSTDSCALLSIYADVEFYEKENYNFFLSGKDSIAIIKPHFKTPLEAFKNVIGACDKETSFEFDKRELIAFCDFVTTVSGSLLPECTMSIKDKTMFLTLNDPAYEISDSREILGVGKYEMDKVSFNPKVYSAYLKAIPYTLVRLSAHSQKGALSLWTIEDEQFNGVLVGLV
jgi:hypothetical protein